MRIFNRLTFEFWPNWLLYFPVYLLLPYWLLRYRQLGIVSLANPGFYLGGIKNENKLAILRKLPSSLIPKTIALDPHHVLDDALARMKRADINFPCILKPQFGERGNGVEKIHNANELLDYLLTAFEPLMLQEFIGDQEEFGVLCFRDGEGAWKISSIVRKEFLQVKGNGRDTLQTLIESHNRAYARQDYLLQKFADKLELVLANGENLMLEPIGNHCRGTSFRNANYLITPTLELVFEDICKQIDGFNIGRFDIKVPSLDLLKEGKQIKVLELNGVTSEPAHIYEPGRGFMKGWVDLLTHWHRVFTLGNTNRSKGLKAPSAFSLYQQLKVKEQWHE